MTYSTWNQSRVRAADGVTECDAGLCLCGCGQTTPIAQKNDRARANVKGQHLRYVVGHNFRGRPLEVAYVDDYAVITMVGGRKTLVDPDVAALMAGKRCYVSSNGYVRLSAEGHVKRYLHRDVMQPSAGMTVDHINGDRLDNRRRNLRVCTPEENRRNLKPRPGREGRKGTFRSRGKSVWVAAIYNNGRKHHIGSFVSEEEAARAYDEAARRLFGEFASCNYPESTEGTHA